MEAFLRLCNSESVVSGAKTVPGDYITLLKLICKWSNFINKKMSRKTRNNKNRCNNYKKNYISNKNNMIVASLNDIQYKIDVLTEEIKKKMKRSKQLLKLLMHRSRNRNLLKQR